MYNIKGPSKIVAKNTRRGISQNLENLHNQNRNKKIFDRNENEILNGPKPVFNSRRGVSSRKSKEGISPDHEELVKFISESWNSVTSELNSNNCNKDNIKKNNDEYFIQESQSVKYYEDKPNPSILPNFNPFDLEAWWGKRLYSIITSSVNSKN